MGWGISPCLALPCLKQGSGLRSPLPSLEDQAFFAHNEERRTYLSHMHRGVD